MIKQNSKTAYAWIEEAYYIICAKMKHRNASLEYKAAKMKLKRAKAALGRQKRRYRYEKNKD